MATLVLHLARPEEQCGVQAVFVPGAVASQTFRVADDDTLQALPAGEESAPGDRLVHAAYDEEGNLSGVAIEAAGMGYADTIRVLYGYSVEDDAIISSLKQLGVDFGQGYGIGKPRPLIDYADELLPFELPTGT